MRKTHIYSLSTRKVQAEEVRTYFIVEHLAITADSDTCQLNW